MIKMSEMIELLQEQMEKTGDMPILVQTSKSTTKTNCVIMVGKDTFCTDRGREDFTYIV